jgi:hypothetical protein
LVGGLGGTIRATLIGIAVSVPVTLVSVIVSFPLAFYSLQFVGASLGLLGPVLAFASIPILANIFVWRAYMTKSSRVTQYSLLVTGIILSMTFAFIFLIGLILWMLADA